MKIEGLLAYNKSTKRYGVLVSDLWRIPGLHCGQRMDVMIDGVWQHARMEMDKQKWYALLDDGTRIVDADMEYMRVRIDD